MSVPMDVVTPAKNANKRKSRGTPAATPAAVVEDQASEVEEVQKEDHFALTGKMSEWRKGLTVEKSSQAVSVFGTLKSEYWDFSKKSVLLRVFGGQNSIKLGLGMDLTNASGIKAFLFKFYGFTVEGLEKYGQDKSSSLWEVLVEENDDKPDQFGALRKVGEGLGIKFLDYPKSPIHTCNMRIVHVPLACKKRFVRDLVGKVQEEILQGFKIRDWTRVEEEGDKMTLGHINLVALIESSQLHEDPKAFAFTSREVYFEGRFWRVEWLRACPRCGVEHEGFTCKEVTKVLGDTGCSQEFRAFFNELALQAAKGPQLALVKVPTKVNKKEKAPLLVKGKAKTSNKEEGTSEAPPKKKRRLDKA